MNFTIELGLSEAQRRALCKLGLATKRVYNYAIERLDINFNKTKRILSANELYEELNIGKGIDEEILEYSSDCFVGVIQVALGAYRSYILHEGKKPTKRELDSFEYVVYLDKKSLELRYDGVLLKNKNLFPKIDDNSSLYLLKAKKSKILFADKDVRDVKIRYDGIFYFLYGEIVGNKKGQSKGLMLEFDKKYFISSPSGIQIKRLTENEAFMNKCLIVKDLEENINTKTSKNRKIYEAEYHSLDFTKKQIKVFIDNYVREAMKDIFFSNPKSICVNFIDYNRYCSSLKERVNLYLLKLVRDKISRYCRNNKIEYIIAPTHKSEELYQTIAL